MSHDEIFTSLLGHLCHQIDATHTAVAAVNARLTGFDDAHDRRLDEFHVYPELIRSFGTHGRDFDRTPPTGDRHPRRARPGT